MTTLQTIAKNYDPTIGLTINDFAEPGTVYVTFVPQMEDQYDAWSIPVLWTPEERENDEIVFEWSIEESLAFLHSHTHANAHHQEKEIHQKIW